MYGLACDSKRAVSGPLRAAKGEELAKVSNQRRIRRETSRYYKDIRFAPKTLWLEAMQRRPTRRAVAGVASRRAPSDPAAPTDARLGRRTRRSAALTS